MINKLSPEQLENFITPIVRSYAPEDLLSQVRVDKVAASWRDFIRLGVGFCYAGETAEGKPGGFLLALHTDDLISGEKHALEYLWMVARDNHNPRLALALFSAFEADAKSAGCYRIVAGCNSVFKRKQLSRWYRMRGYSIFAEAHQKLV